MPQHLSLSLRQIVLLMLVLSFAGCKESCNPTKKTTPSAVGPVQLAGSGDSYVELTAAAAAPSGTGLCKDGIILVAAGNGKQRLLIGTVQPPFPSSYDLAEWDGTQWKKLGTGPFGVPPTASTDGPVGSDSQASRLVNGDLLLMWNGSTKRDLPNNDKLSWWTDWGTPTNQPPEKLAAKFPTGERNGYRPAQVFWRFSCATGQWTTTAGFLDSGTAESTNKDGSLEPGYCAKHPPGVGGFDRPELYVDPWGVNSADNTKQRIYVSTRCARPDDSVQVFVSPDTGLTWKPSRIRLVADTPVALTSNSNGRLFLFQQSGKRAVLHWSDDHGESLTSPPEGYDVTYVVAKPDLGQQSEYEVDQLPANVTGVGLPSNSLSMARAGANGVLAVYPALEQISGGPTFRQVAAVVWILTKPKGQDPVVVPIKIIRAQAAEGSVFLASFIEDDAADQKLNTSLLYWLETTGRPATDTTPVTMLARYVVFSGIVPSQEGVLSDAAGWEANNRKKYKALGDYMKGGFYRHEGKLNFVAVWPQVPASVSQKDKTQAYMRVVTFTPDPASAQPPPKAQELPNARTATRSRARSRPSRVQVDGP